MEFSGRLAAFPMQDLLQWAGNERRTGALVVRRSRREKWVLFHKGWIVGCLSDNPSEFFGQYLILNDYLDAPTLVDILAYSKKHSVRLGAALTQAEVLDEETVKEALSQHIQDTLCDLFLWKHGVFFFRDEEPEASKLAPAPIDSMAVLMEGGRWIDEYNRIREEAFPHENVVLGSGSPVVDDVTPLQRKIIDRVDGMATLHDIRQELRGSLFRILEAAYHSLRDEYVQIIAVGEEPEGGQSEDVSLFDVLFEHAAEKQVVEWSSDLGLPINLVETFFPVWVGDPDERTLVSSVSEDFVTSLDGSTILRELFSLEPEERAGQYHWLVDQLRRHNVALLPSPISEESVSSEADKGAMSGIKRWWKRVTPGS